MDKDRIEFTKSSLLKSADFDNDPMIKFIILWIGFNALYDDGDGQEKEKIHRYFLTKENLVKDLLKNKNSELNEIAHFVDNTHQHTRLSEFLRTRRSFLGSSLNCQSIHDFSQFIYQIRNNMFHAEKLWNQEDEAMLLKMINPVFEDILSIFISKQEIPS